MNVLLVHHGYPPEALGGSEIYTQALARRLSERHTVGVLHRSADFARPEHDLRESTRDGISLWSLNNLQGAASGFESYRDPELGRLASGVIDAARPDLVHIGHLEGLSTGVVFEARRRGVPVVITLHDFWPFCPLGQLLNLDLEVCPGPTPRRCLGCVGEQVAVPRQVLGPVRSIAGRIPFAAGAGRLLARVGDSGSQRVARRLEEMREVLRAADAVIAPSDFVRERVAALGLRGVEVLPCGLERPHFPPRQADPEGRVRFGFVGAAIPSKGVHVLASAYRRLHDRRASLEIHGAFAGPEANAYERQVRAILGGEAEAAIRGPFPHERIGEVLASLDVLVVPSLWEETGPIVAREAFLAGLPVVASDHGGLAECVREGIDGLRVRPNDVEHLARALRRLLDEPELRASLAKTPPPVPTMADHVVALESIYERARRRFRERVGAVGVVVLNCGRPLDAAEAARSVLDDASLTPRVVVVENGPGPEPSLPEGVELLRLPENRGYAAGMNAGMAALRDTGCDRFLLLNNDAVLDPGCLRRLAEALEDEGAAAVGPVVFRRADGRVESVGASFDPRSGRNRLSSNGRPAEPREERRETESLSGAAWMLHARALDRLGPLDEGLFFSFEETEWCLRARRSGFRLAVVLGAGARHAGSRTLGVASPQRLYYAARNQLRVAERHAPLSVPARWLRRGLILGRNVAFALKQGDVPRVAALRAVLVGTADFWRGRVGPVGPQ